jgi:hypothetical protein
MFMWIIINKLNVHYDNHELLYVGFHSIQYSSNVFHSLQNILNVSLEIEKMAL